MIHGKLLIKSLLVGLILLNTSFTIANTDVVLVGGAVSGLVVDVNNQPIKSCDVTLLDLSGAGKHSPSKSDTLKNHQDARNLEKGGNEPLKTATDDNGKFKFDGIVDGNYLVSAGSPLTGHSSVRIVMKDGKEVQVNLKVKPRRGSSL